MGLIVTISGAKSVKGLEIFKLENLNGNVDKVNF